MDCSYLKGAARSRRKQGSKVITRATDATGARCQRRLDGADWDLRLLAGFGRFGMIETKGRKGLSERR